MHHCQRDYRHPPSSADHRRTSDAKHPGIEIEIVATNAASDLARREADIAVRSFKPTQPDLVAKKLRVSNARLYAAPSYLEKIGNPTMAEDLSEAEFINFDRTNALVKGLNMLGLKLTAKNFPLITSNQLVQWELAKQGTAICIMMEEIAESEPRVQLVLPDLPPIPVPMWLTSHREVRTSRRVRVVFDLLAEGLKV